MGAGFRLVLVHNQELQMILERRNILRKGHRMARYTGRSLAPWCRWNLQRDWDMSLEQDGWDKRLIDTMITRNIIEKMPVPSHCLCTVSPSVSILGDAVRIRCTPRASSNARTVQSIPQR